MMIAQDPRTDQLNQPSDQFRGFSAERRDRAPFIETEDYREEGARRMWDDFSPPNYKAKKGPDDTWMANSAYLFTSESFALGWIGRYFEYWQNRISNTDPAHSRWSSYASIYFSDSAVQVSLQGTTMPAKRRARRFALQSVHLISVTKRTSPRRPDEMGMT